MLKIFRRSDPGQTPAPAPLRERPREENRVRITWTISPGLASGHLAPERSGESSTLGQDPLRRCRLGR